jgi:hypothetical protein
MMMSFQLAEKDPNSQVVGIGDCWLTLSSWLEQLTLDAELGSTRMIAHRLQNFSDTHGDDGSTEVFPYVL